MSEVAHRAFAQRPLGRERERNGAGGRNIPHRYLCNVFCCFRPISLRHGVGPAFGAFGVVLKGTSRSTVLRARTREDDGEDRTNPGPEEAERLDRHNELRRTRTGTMRQETDSGDVGQVVISHPPLILHPNDVHVRFIKTSSSPMRYMSGGGIQWWYTTNEKKRKGVSRTQSMTRLPIRLLFFAFLFYVPACFFATDFLT